MKTKVSIVLALFVALWAGRAEAADVPQTSIQVVKMHCGGCAKRLAAKLYTVPGVTAVSFDLQSKTLFVTPQTNAAPSPRALWEAIELAKDTPVQLAGPQGTFTAKPSF